MKNKIWLWIVSVFFSISSKAENSSFAPFIKPKGDPFEDLLLLLLKLLAVVCVIAFIGRCIFGTVNAFKNMKGDSSFLFEILEFSSKKVFNFSFMCCLLMGAVLWMQKVPIR